MRGAVVAVFQDFLVLFCLQEGSPGLLGLVSLQGLAQIPLSRVPQGSRVPWVPGSSFHLVLKGRPASGSLDSLAFVLKQRQDMLSNAK